LERNYVNEETDKVQKCANRRYLKIELTDQLVWDTVLEVLSHSNLFKEEVKKQVMGESITHRDQSEQIKKLKRKLKVVEKDISDVTNSIVNLETDKILKRRDRQELEQILKNVEDARIELEVPAGAAEGPTSRFRKPDTLDGLSCPNLPIGLALWLSFQPKNASTF